MEVTVEFFLLKWISIGFTVVGEHSFSHRKWAEQDLEVGRYAQGHGLQNCDLGSLFYLCFWFLVANKFTVI
jgi:hypothetical protein